MRSRIRLLTYFLQAAVQWRPWPRPRDLRREHIEQATEDYWRRREQFNAWRFNVVKLRYRFSSFATSLARGTGLIRGTVVSLVRSVASGALVVAIVLVIEQKLFHDAGIGLMPTGDPRPPLGAFPALTVQVLAAFLGFYLATIGIVLGNAYHEVSAAVRSLILMSTRTRLYLSSIGLSIGAGLLLVLLESFGLLSFGYLTAGVYVLLVGFGSWAFVQLVRGAFGLMNPVVLAEEPLEALDRAVNRLDAKGLLQDDAVLSAVANDASSALQILAELVSLTKDRPSVNRRSLAAMIDWLLFIVRNYARKKHQLTPTSGWFIREPAYPRWVEAPYSATSIALKTSTPLIAQIEPVPDWLEKRAAKLVSAAIEACAEANDADEARRMIRSSGQTARTYARCYRIDEAIAFAEIVRDGCWNLASRTEAASSIAAESPFLLTDVFLGWRTAIVDWHEEINRTVNRTNWDRRTTREVSIRGPGRVWTAAQRLIEEIHAEHAIEGRRVTPDWFLRSALATECVIALREFAERMPVLLESYGRHPSLQGLSPPFRAATASQALQMLSKADQVSLAMTQELERINGLAKAAEIGPAPEIEKLPTAISDLRAVVLQEIANSLVGMQPDQSKSGPDHFGEAFFTLMHHLAQAIEAGETALIEKTFPQLIQAGMVMHDHIMSTYRPPTFTQSPALLNTLIDLFELSGLALAYDALRNDQSADFVRTVWTSRIQNTPCPTKAAKCILDIVDISSAGLHTSVRRHEWVMCLSQQIVAAGYARPEYIGFGDPPEWNAPPLIKILGVSEHMPSISLDLHVIFAANIIGPLSGETDEHLRDRRGLKRFFSEREFYDPSADPDSGNGCAHDGGQTSTSV